MFLSQCASVLIEALKHPVAEPFKNIATAEMLYWGNHWYLLTVRPHQKRVDCVFEHVYVGHSRHTIFPYSFHIDSQDLPQLLKAGDTLIEKFENLLSKPEWKSKKEFFESLETTYRFRIVGT